MMQEDRCGQGPTDNDRECQHRDCDAQLTGEACQGHGQDTWFESHTAESTCHGQRDNRQRLEGCQ